MMTNKLFQVSLSYLFRYKGALPFDIFIQRFPGKYSCVHKQHGMYDPDQISHFEAKVEFLYVDEAHLPEFKSFLSNILEQTLVSSEKLNSIEINEIMALGLELTFKEIINQTGDINDNLKNSNLYVKSCLKILSDNPLSGVDIFLSIAQDLSLLKHSFHVMLLTLTMAKKSGFTSEKVLASIGVGALLHDIGHSLLDQEILLKQRLTPKEWEIIKDHPHLGVKLVDSCQNLPHEIRSIILQHHEYCNGRGYPNRLSQTQIFPPARLVAVADVFSSLTIKSNYRNVTYAPQEAIDIMKSDIGHFDPSYLDTLQEMFIKK